MAGSPHVRRHPDQRDAELEIATKLGMRSERRLDDERIRELALLIFVEPLPSGCLLLERRSLGEWKRLLRWLDYSGLALYFFDRIVELGLESVLPDTIFERLLQNLADNTARTRGMIAESIGIQREFQEAQLRYANLKGFSLVPHSVPRPELRSQFDLDFLVSEKDSSRARVILEQRGYRLYGASARSWEFKRNERPGFSLKDLYKDLQSWRVELHVETSDPGKASVLDRLDWRTLNGFRMPELPPVDAFAGQGLHAYKHICSEFSRTAHLLEFRRHVLFRRADEEFWIELRGALEGNLQACLGLGIVTQLITQTMGEFALDALSKWTVDSLPPSIQLWVRTYGRRALLGSFPGSKLYLLLQGELERAGMPARRTVRNSLVPSNLPPAIIRAAPDEPFRIRMARYRMQLGFFLSRFLFHITEGARYAWELQRWRRLRNQNAC